jgi:hypothetical protein
MLKSIAGIAIVMVFATPAWSGEGCTPGYWKNHNRAWPSSILQCQTDVDVSYHTFGHDLGLPELYTNTALPDPGLTQGEALSLPGGSGVEGARMILIRQAVAAVLNAHHPDVDFSVAPCEVIASVNVVLASQDREAMLGLEDALHELNSLGCPL